MEFYEDKIIKTEATNFNSEIDCNDAFLNQNFKSGKYTVNLKKENGKVYVSVHSDEVIEKNTYSRKFVGEMYDNFNFEVRTNYVSSEKYNTLLSQRDSILSIKEKLIVKDTEVTKALSFWDWVKLHIYMILFYLLLALWIFGITPRYLIGKIF